MNPFFFLWPASSPPPQIKPNSIRVQPMTTPTFTRHINGPISALAAPYTPGNGAIALVDATRLGNPTPTVPVRLTVVAANGSAVLGQFLAIGRSGNLVEVEVDAGYNDVPLPAGSNVANTDSAEDLRDVEAAVLDAYGVLATLQAAIGAAQATLALLKPVATSGAYGDLTGRPSLATVATTGSYADLANRPALGTLAGQNGTFSGTHSGSSSGINTGDQADITGQAGTVATIAGLITPGANVTISGGGTIASPFLIAASGGGSASPGGTLGSIQYAGPDSTLAGGLLKTNGSSTLSTTATSLVLQQTGDSYGLTRLEMLNRDGANGFRLTCSLWLADFIFYTEQTNKQNNLRVNTDSSCLPANFARGGEFYFFMDVTGANPALACRIGTGACEWYAPTTFIPTATAGTPVTVKAAPGQSAPLFRALDSTGNLLSSIDNAGAFQPAQLADSAAAAGTLYYSTTAGKLVFKDPAGVVNPLY